MMHFSPDRELQNADWPKGTWDLPYKSEEELKKGCSDYKKFKKTPAYAMRPWAHQRALDFGKNPLQKSILPVTSLNIINRKGDE